jgi:hypothetical protein
MSGVAMLSNSGSESFGLDLTDGAVVLSLRLAPKLPDLLASSIECTVPTGIEWLSELLNRLELWADERELFGMVTESPAARIEFSIGGAPQLITSADRPALRIGVAAPKIDIEFRMLVDETVVRDFVDRTRAELR